MPKLDELLDRNSEYSIRDTHFRTWPRVREAEDVYQLVFEIQRQASAGQKSDSVADACEISDLFELLRSEIESDLEISLGDDGGFGAVIVDVSEKRVLLRVRSMEHPFEGHNVLVVRKFIELFLTRFGPFSAVMNEPVSYWMKHTGY